MSIASAERLAETRGRLISMRRIMRPRLRNDRRETRARVASLIGRWGSTAVDAVARSRIHLHFDMKIESTSIHRSSDKRYKFRVRQTESTRCDIRTVIFHLVREFGVSTVSADEIVVDVVLGSLFLNSRHARKWRWKIKWAILNPVISEFGYLRWRRKVRYNYFKLLQRNVWNRKL